MGVLSLAIGFGLALSAALAAGGWQDNAEVRRTVATATKAEVSAPATPDARPVWYFLVSQAQADSQAALDDVLASFGLDAHGQGAISSLVVVSSAVEETAVREHARQVSEETGFTRLVIDLRPR